MLFRETLADELNKKTAEFEKFLFEYSADADKFLGALGTVENLKIDEIRSALSVAGCHSAGVILSQRIFPASRSSRL